MFKTGFETSILIFNSISVWLSFADKRGWFQWPLCSPFRAQVVV